MAKFDALIVDDDEQIQLFLSKALATKGYHCKSAGDGMEALALLEENEFDVILTDLDMPNIDGLTLLDRLALMNCRAVPIILTGFGDVVQASQAVKLGAYDFLMKPILLNVLFDVVHRAMERRKSLD